MKSLDDVKGWVGLAMVDAGGATIGTIDHIYLDRHTGEPEWSTVRTGLFGSKSSFVPIGAAQRSGDEIRVAFTREQVKDAPRVDADAELATDEEQRLYEHYGRSDYGAWQGWDCTTPLGLPDDADGRFERSDAEALRDAPGAMPLFAGVRLRRGI